MGKGFPLKRQQKPKVPVEEEGKWERQRGSCPAESEARSQAHIYRDSTWGGRKVHPQKPIKTTVLSPHTLTKAESPTPIETPRRSTHPALRTQEIEFKGMGRREEGGRSGKAQEKATT